MQIYCIYVYSYFYFVIYLTHQYLMIILMYPVDHMIYSVLMIIISFLNLFFVVLVMEVVEHVVVVVVRYVVVVLNLVLMHKLIILYVYMFYDYSQYFFIFCIQLKNIRGGNISYMVKIDLMIDTI